MLLVQKPKVILLDEPVAGMGKPETYKTGEILKQIKNECTVVIVEHDMEFVKMIADMVTVMHEVKCLWRAILTPYLEMKLYRKFI